MDFKLYLLLLFTILATGGALQSQCSHGQCEIKYEVRKTGYIAVVAYDIFAVYDDKGTEKKLIQPTSSRFSIVGSDKPLAIVVEISKLNWKNPEHEAYGAMRIEGIPTLASGRFPEAKVLNGRLKNLPDKGSVEFPINYQSKKKEGSIKVRLIPFFYGNRVNKQEAFITLSLDFSTNKPLAKATDKVNENPQAIVKTPSQKTDADGTQIAGKLAINKDGCSNEKALWKMAREQDDIISYRNFIKHCPNGKLAAKARSFLQRKVAVCDSLFHLAIEGRSQEDLDSYRSDCQSHDTSKWELINGLNLAKGTSLNPDSRIPVMDNTDQRSTGQQATALLTSPMAKKQNIEEFIVWVLIALVTLLLVGLIFYEANK